MLFRHWLSNKMNENTTGRSSSFISKIGDLTSRYIDRWSISIYIWLRKHSFSNVMHNESSHLIHSKSSSHDHFVPAMPYHQLVTQWSNGMSGICTQYPRLSPEVYLIGILLNEAFMKAILLSDIRTTRTIAFYDPIYSYISISPVPAERDINNILLSPQIYPA